MSNRQKTDGTRKTTSGTGRIISEHATIVQSQSRGTYKGSMLNVAFMNPTNAQNEMLANAPGEGDLTLKSSKLYIRAMGRRTSKRLKSKSSGAVETPTKQRRLSTMPSNTITVRPSIDIRESSRMITRWDRDLHRFVCALTESSRFNGFIMLMIIFNTVVLAVETSPTLRYEYEMTLAIVDQSLLAIYTVEAILRIYAEPKSYWLQVSNLFDFLLVVVSLCQPLIEMFVKGAGGVMVFRMFRALKALRTLRSVSFSTNLQVLVSALIDTMRRYVVSVIILLVFIMFLFGVVGYYLFGSNKFAADESAREDWGTLGRAMLSLFTYVTADGWTAVQENIDAADMTGKWSRLYTIGFICIGHFIMTNVFIGIIIMNISEATETFRQERRRERELAVKRKKAFMMQRQREDINRMVEKQRRGNWRNFYEMVQSFQESLSHDDYTTVNEMCTNPVWILTLLNTLDYQDQTLENLMNLYFEMLHTLARMSETEGKAPDQTHEVPKS